MKPKSAFVRTQSAVELHTVSTVDLRLAFVVFPDNTELNDAFWDRGNLEGSSVFGMLFEESAVLEG